ncbi:2-oxoacid:acceptor oxidoreductase family protein [Candidatus Woesearchaeota archaeon]|nr:2-oxoacid:acceptor oxidoreductase family protein [Candidatus Woesearchaeota archaeon]
MIEIRLHGRGGQGVKKASQILGRAAYIAGYKTQDFALYGAERRGAPVTSFVRIDKKEIRTRGYIFEPDYILIMDNTIDLRETLKGKKKSTIVLANSVKGLRHECVIDADKIVMEETGNVLGVNIAMLGAFVTLFKQITIEHLTEAIKIELSKYSKDVVERNINIIKKSYNHVLCSR